MNIILLPALLFFIVVFLLVIAPKIRSKIGSLITWKRSLIIAGIYLGILIMSVPILYLLADKGFIKLVENSSEKATILQNAINDLDNHTPLEADLDNQPGLYKNSSHTFKAGTNKLAFNLVANMGNYRIFVEPKDVEDGKIEVRTYAATQLAEGIDLTRLVLPPIITFQNGTLSLESNHQQRLDFKQFKSDFTAEQFNNHNKVNGKGSLTQFGEKVIYILVPKSLEIDKGKYNDQIQMLSST
ncbi:MAG: hypothetical protein APF81_18850 [Desulfosporosinus sp. BRH_c37]|nr:MAG: hypothetical protein APF81_18850 [Desulfosporosinus sp. BRH_c37]